MIDVLHLYVAADAARGNRDNEEPKDATLNGRRDGPLPLRKSSCLAFTD